MLESIISIMSGFNTAHDFYKRVSGIIKGDQNETAQHLKQMNDNLAGIKLEFERLSDKILYTPMLQGVQDITQSRQRTIDDLREVRASLEPVQQSIGDEILSSTMILTPEKMQKAMIKNPWEVLQNISPVKFSRPHSDPNMVPVLFTHDGVQYIGWQMRGTLPILFDCQYNELWMPSQPGFSGSQRKAEEERKRQAEIAKQKAEEENRRQAEITNYRYIDNGNGTVTDNRTGLVWLKNANCFGKQNWEMAKKLVAKLADGQCGLSDGSKPGDWRLPTKEEWEAMIDKKYKRPGLSNAAGTDKWKEGDAFSGVKSSYYWSSASSAHGANNAWYVRLVYGIMDFGNKTGTYYVWPVRGGQ